MPATLEIGEGLIRSHDLLEELNNDILEAYKALENDRVSQYLRRCLVRCVFAYIEAVIEIIKVELRSNLRTGFCTVELTEKEKKVIGSLSINREDDPRIGLEDNLKRTFKLAFKIWKIDDYCLETSGEDYQDFLRAKHARDKLTHPKTYYDIQVTDQDMSYHSIAAQWVRNSFEQLFKLRVDQLRSGIGIEYDGI